MRIADLLLASSLALLLCAVPASVLALLVRRAGRADRAVRRTVRIGVSAAVLLLLAQALVVIGIETGALTGLDGPALGWFVAHRSGWATGFAIVLAALGGTAALAVLTVTAMLVLVYLGQWRRALLLGGTAAGAGLLVQGFKELYQRHRPPKPDQVIHYSGYALPSGHSLGSLVVFGVLTATLVPALRGASRAWLLLGAVALVLLVGWSRVYLAAHWMTDVLTGWLLGGAWLALGVTALAVLARAPEEDRPGTSAGTSAGTDAAAGQPANR
jgi:membrane-associated phospholipid phosphatase